MVIVVQVWTLLVQKVYFENDITEIYKIKQTFTIKILN